MKRIIAAAKSLAMTGWFVKASWGYIVTRRPSSKVEFIVGIVPAWFRFTISTYKDIRPGV